MKIIYGFLLSIFCASSVQATIDHGISDNQGELFLTVWNASNGLSYTRDLNLTMEEMETSSYQSFSSDALYKRAFQGTDPSSLIYNVVAITQADTNGGDNLPALYGSAGNNGIMTTSNDSDVTVNELAFNQIQLQVGNWINSVNSILGGNDSVTSFGSDPAAFANAGMGTNLAGFSGFNTTAAVGQSLAFHWLELDVNFDTFEFFVTSKSLAGLWTLDANGTLTYSAGSVNPVPVPAASWLLISGLLSFGRVIRLRKN